MNRPSGSFTFGAAEPMAVIGMSCNLPGDNRTPDSLWKFLLRKGSGIKEIPEDRFAYAPFYDPDPDALGRSVTKWAGFIEDARGFDAKFFGISPREAAAIDPQQRLVLQGAYEAMEDSMIPIEEYRRQSTGVFVGVSQSEYRSLQEMNLTKNEQYAGTGYALCINANRVSHRLNLKGPSYALDTACSSSLTVMDQAVHNLRNGACDMAIVAGVNMIVHPLSFIAFSKAGMVSPTGTISTFDAAANGFVRGEGVGVVILKPLTRAMADGDRIHAVIHATNVNQDGHTGTITAPDQQAQIDMLRGLFAKTDIAPSDIGYVEAHGTGTPIGDPIESGAIGTVIGRGNTENPVLVGSIKANIGHLESGAGVAGLLKCILAIKNGQVPPNANFKTPNPNIPFDALNLRVPTKTEAFPESEGTRFAVVNSFGFGGTNASALVSSAPPSSNAHHPASAAPAAAAEVPDTAFPLFFPISGATPEAIGIVAGDLLRAMRKGGLLHGVSLQDLSGTLANARSHLAHRAVILARSEKELKSALRKLAAGETEIDNVLRGQAQGGRRLCFMFSGQGSQWWAMARDLLQHNPVFAGAVDAYDAHFRKVAGWSIKEELLRDKDTSRIDDTTVTQPALFAIQSGLAAVWKDLGVEPDMVVGHSIGEAAAAYVAGGMSLSGAARFLSKRGTIRDQLGAKGAMAAIGLNHEDVEALLPDHGKLGIAAINGPGSTTISGDYDALHDFVEEFELMNPDTFIRRLTVDTAWHSYQLDAGEEWFRREMSSIDWSVPHLPFISTVTGKMESRFDTDYGWLNLRCPVRFQHAIETAIDMGATTFLELGPHGTLAGPAKSTALEAGAQAAILNSLARRKNDFDTLAHAAAALFVLGHALDWSKLAPKPARMVELPPHGWEEEPYWDDSYEARQILHRENEHPFLGIRSEGNAIVWISQTSVKSTAFLKDHKLQSDVIFPAAGYIDTMIAAGRELFGTDAVLEIENARIHEALFIGPEDEVMFSVVYNPATGKVEMFSQIRDAGDDDWVLRAEGKLRAIDVKRPAPRAFDAEARNFARFDRDLAYDVDSRLEFINYGDTFQVIEDLWMTPSKTAARLVFKDTDSFSNTRFFVHPTMLDGCLQITDPRMTPKRIVKPRQPGDDIFLPLGAARIRYFAPFPEEIFVEASRGHDKVTGERTAGLVARDAEGNVVMTIDGLMMSILPSKKSIEAQDEVPAHTVRQTLAELPESDAAEPLLDGAWVVLDSDDGHAKGLIAAMTKAGADVRHVPRADLGEDVSGALIDLLAEEIEDGRIAGIVAAWPLAIPQTDDDTPTDALFAPINECTTDLIALGDMMDYARTGEHGLPQIVFLTSGAYPDGARETAPARILSQMPVAALARGIATETPEYALRVIDADDAALSAPAALAARVLSPSPETEIILRGDKVLAPRLRHVASDDLDPTLLQIPASDTTTNFHATMRNAGVIDHLELNEIPLQELGPDDVRLRIAAVGLNFRDVMAVTGLLPKEAEPDPAWQNLGLEYGAVIEAVGENVKNLAPGDRVMGMGRRCLQRFMTADPRTLTKLPDTISLSEAATIPTAFATAHYALNHVGRMRAGESVLIHVATGGVGMAAVQLAKAAGAEIFATAGSPAKRKLLKEMGVDHVMNSRTLDFADDVMRITKGRGVDLLLNSLPGDYIVKGLDIMAPYGRFLEIGKRDVYEDSAIGMKALRRNVSLSVLDLAAMGSDRPEFLAEIFAELAGKLGEGALTPLRLTEFPLSKISDAIRYMSQAKHVGKVVVSMDEPVHAVRRDPNRAVTLSGDASYLITGGTAGFSLSIAEWMSRAGAGHLYLASRSGKIEKSRKKFIEKIEARGTEVTALSLDITDSDAVEAFVSMANASSKPLRGVVHGAAVIKDAFISQMTPELVTEVLSPKIKGAWNLHRAFAKAGVEPDFLIGFSSISQVTGSAGQTNYIAGNAFLDALAHYRAGLGRPGTAIDWGVIGDDGFVARNAALSSYLESVGQFGLRRRETWDAMDLALSREMRAFCYSRADWQQVTRANPALGASPRLSTVLQSDGGGTQEVRLRLMQLDGDALVEASRDFIMDEITSVLKVEKSSIQTDRPMSELGLDSLSSFELKIRIETALDFSMPVSKFLKAPSVDELAVTLGQEIEQIKQSAEAADVADGGNDGAGKGPRSGAATSNRQQGLLRDAGASMTSDAARRAMEYHATTRAPEGCDFADVEAALKRLVRRHPMLRMRIKGDGRMALDGAGPTLIQGATDTLLDIAEGEFARLSVVADDHGLVLQLAMHMAMGDAQSAETALADLLALLRGDDLPKAVGRAALLRQVAAMHHDPDTATGQNDQAFWWYSLGDGAAPVPFAARGRALVPARAGRDHGPAGTLTGALPAKTSQAAVMMGLAAALRRVTDSTGPVLMGREVSLRHGLPKGAAAIGPFDIEQPIVVPDDPKDSSAVAALTRTLRHAGDHIAFDSFAAASVFEDWFADRTPTPFQVMVAFGNAPSVAPKGLLHDVVLRIWPEGRGMRFALSHDRDILDTATAQAICDALVATFKDATPEAMHLETT